MATGEILRDLATKLLAASAEMKLAERIEASVRRIMVDRAAVASGRFVGDRDRRDAECASTLPSVALTPT